MKKSATIKLSLVISGRKNTFSLEKDFWVGLQKIAKSRNTTAAILAKDIAKQSRIDSLPSALRIYVFRHFRSSHPPSDSQRLRARAKEYRLLADRVKDRKSRKAIRVIAYDYEQMAAKAERS
jgi:predicted DNA-binding ribbon-helix-helix protein